MPLEDRGRNGRDSGRAGDPWVSTLPLPLLDCLTSVSFCMLQLPSLNNDVTALNYVSKLVVCFIPHVINSVKDNSEQKVFLVRRLTDALVVLSRAECVSHDNSTVVCASLLDAVFTIGIGVGVTTGRAVTGAPAATTATEAVVCLYSSWLQICFLVTHIQVLVVLHNLSVDKIVCFCSFCDANNYIIDCNNK